MDALGYGPPTLSSSLSKKETGALDLGIVYCGPSYLDVSLLLPLLFASESGLGDSSPSYLWMRGRSSSVGRLSSLHI